MTFLNPSEKFGGDYGCPGWVVGEIAGWLEKSLGGNHTLKSSNWKDYAVLPASVSLPLELNPDKG